MEIIPIPMHKIKIGTRVREARDIDASLVDSIQTWGVLEPIIVSPSTDSDVYLLIHGLRRYVAASALGFKTIDCILDTRIKANEIQLLETTYNDTARYPLSELLSFGLQVERARKLTAVSQFDSLLGLAEGNFLKLKAINAYYEDKKDLEKILNDTQSDPNMLIDKTFKKMEREKKKKQEQPAEEDVEQDTDHSEFIDDKPTDEYNIEDPVVPESLRNYVVNRDGATCQCHCGIGGTQYESILKAYAVVNPLFGGKLEADNLITVCPNCYSMVIKFALADLEISNGDSENIRNIVRLANPLRTSIKNSARPAEHYRDYFKRAF